jgi:hypothetical protein
MAIHVANARARRHADPDDQGVFDMQYKTDIRLAAVVAAFASVGAALIHLAVIPDHWREWILSGLFFAALAFFQFAWAVVVLRSSHRGVIAVGIAANVAAMALWVMTRTRGLPFGPHAGEPDPFGTAGILTTLLEFVVVVTAAWAMLPHERGSWFSPRSYRLALGGAAVLISVIMAVGAVAGLDHSHGGAGHGETDDQHGTPGHHGTGEPDSTHAPGPAPGAVTSPPQAPQSSTAHGHPDEH